MPTRFSLAGGQLLDTWRAMPVAQRFTVALFAIGAMALITLLAGWSSSPAYEVISSNLAGPAAAKISEQLQGAGIPFQLSSDGRTISVPAALAGQARVSAAATGVSTSNEQPGFEALFGQSNPLGMTEQMQRTNYQRALEGELVRSLKRIDGVEDARVHLALPATTLFSERKGEASASVMVANKGGRAFSEDRVASIVSLITGAVENLKPENVTVIDKSGRLLNDGSARISGAANGVAGLRTASNQYAQQRQFEGDVSANLTRTLEQLVGPGAATVKVAALLDWDQQEIQRETYETQPTPAVVSKREQSETSGSGASSGAGGVPGTASNVPSYQQTTAGTTGQTGGYQRSDNVTNFQPSKTVERTVRAPGAIKRLSVMAVVDEKAAEGLNLDQLQASLSAAAAIDAKRGDTVVVTKMPFNHTQVEADAKALQDTVFWENAGGTARSVSSTVAPLVVVVLVAFFLFRNIPKPNISLAPATFATPVRVSELHREASVLEPPRPTEDPRTKAVRQQISTLAKDEPETVSALISTLLDDKHR